MQQLDDCFFSIFQGASSTATKGRETLYQAGFVRKRLDPEVTTALKIHRVSPNVKYRLNIALLLKQQRI
jgi:hypothetical protein